MRQPLRSEAVAFVACMLLGSTAACSTTQNLGPLEVHVIDVGQGDAILIRCPEGIHELLIDAGDNRYRGSAAAFKAYMEAEQGFDNHIEVIVASHPHADHIGSMAWVLSKYTVDLYVDNGNVYDSRTYERVDEAFDYDETSYWSAQDDAVPEIDFCPLDEVSATVLRPEGFGESSDPNDNSVIVRVDYLNDSFLFVGDCESEEENLLMEDDDTRELLDCDFLKVGHHCSNTSSSPDFLDSVTPDISVVSCGEKGVSTNSGYKHPRKAQLELLISHAAARDGPPVKADAFNTVTRKWKKVTLNKAVYVTTAEGDLVFESNGNGIRRR